MEIRFSQNIEDIKYKGEMSVHFTCGRVVTFSIKDGDRDWAYFDLDVDEFKKIVDMVKDIEE